MLENGTGTTTAIPLPAGVAAMHAVTVEMAPSGRPFVRFRDNVVLTSYVAFFDGTGFVGLTDLGPSSAAHADAAKHIVVLGTDGLVRHAPGVAPVVLGAFPQTPVAWTVGTDGTVHMLRSAELVDTIPTAQWDAAKQVGGGIALLAAQDFDHVEIVTRKNHVLRRCAPFTGSRGTWPAEKMGRERGG